MYDIKNLRGVSVKKMNDIEVIINNKRYTLRGYESEEYLQKVASFINNKHGELKGKDFYKVLDSETKSVLLEINLADEYFKIKDQVREIELENENKSNEIYELKHEIIAAHTEKESLYLEVEELKHKLLEAQEKIIRLETEIIR